MTRTIEIPREKWPSFLKMLNRLADGRPVRLEVARRDLGDQEMGGRLPLQDIDLETKGSERGKLTITVGSDRGELTHLIAQPTHISIGLNDVAEPQWLGIDEPNEAVTIIHFEQLPALEREYAAEP